MREEAGVRSQVLRCLAGNVERDLAYGREARGVDGELVRALGQIDLQGRDAGEPGQRGGRQVLGDQEELAERSVGCGQGPVVLVQRADTAAEAQEGQLREGVEPS